MPHTYPTVIQNRKRIGTCSITCSDANHQKSIGNIVVELTKSHPFCPRSNGRFPETGGIFSGGSRRMSESCCILPGCLCRFSKCGRVESGSQRLSSKGGGIISNSQSIIPEGNGSISRCNNIFPGSKGIGPD